MATRSPRLCAARWLLVLLILSSQLASVAPTLAQQQPEGDNRLFVETGFRVSDDAFWDYFTHRGGLTTFGYPISREFTLLGFPVQFFQREVLQRKPDGSVGTLNLLDQGLMPYTEINGSVYPAPDPRITSLTPLPDTPDYGTRMLEFIRATVPDLFDGQDVNFFQTFSNTVRMSDAFPNGGGSPDLLLLMDLEIWGAPTSQPAYDPNNRNFIYQRFQRGIMHYDAGCRCTQGILLADYFKSLIIGENLPPDLATEAAQSPFLRQYDPSKPLSLARPAELPGTDLTNAFVKDTESAAALSTRAVNPGRGGGAAGAGGGGSSTSTGTAPAAALAPASTGSMPDTVWNGVALGLATSPPYRLASPEYGLGVFVWGRPDAATTLRLVSSLRFTWQKSLIRWRDVESAGKGQYDWQAADALLQASQAAGVRVLARVDFPPAGARADGATNGPPDHYQDYADFLAALVRRYKSGSPYGHLAAIEVWNEPNLAREWGNQPISRQQAADYVRLLALAYAAVKAADPSVLVVTAGLSPTGWNDATARPDDMYLQWLYDAGLKGHYDVLGAHAPGYKAPPEVAPDEAATNPVWGGHRSFTFRRVEDLRAIMVRNGDADKQVAITEFGWTSDPVHPAYAWHAVTEAQKADYLVRAFQWAHQHWAPWIGLMTVWNLPDPSWGPEDEQYWWGIANPDGSPRLAYTALQRARQNGTLP